MNRAGHNAKSASTSKRGFFATLSHPLTSKGSGAPSSRLRHRLALLALSALGAVAMALPASSSAAPHDLLHSFGPDGTAATRFSPTLNPNHRLALSFDDAARRLYASDPGTPGIWVFDASSPLAYPGVAPFTPLATPSPRVCAVDNSDLPSAGNLYCATNSVHGFDAVGAPLPGFPLSPSFEARGAAVDSAGHLWLSRNSSDLVVEFSAAGAQLRVHVFGNPIFGNENQPFALAFDANDDLYVVQRGPSGFSASKLLKRTAASDYDSATMVGPNVSASSNFAVDAKTHHLFVVDENDSDQVKEYDSGGNLLDTFATGIAAADYTGIAVDPKNHFVYVADDGNGKIHVFDAGEPAPSLSLEDPEPLTNTAAPLKGSVGPEGLTVTDCRFDYVTEAAFQATAFADLSSGGSIPCTGAIPADNADHPVSADLSGLKRNTTYFYRIVVTIGGVEHSFQESFITPGPPTVETTGSPVPTPTSAVLSGRVNSQGEDTTYHFEYGTEGPCSDPASACQETDPLPAGDGRLTELVAQRVTGLRPDTTYHYRLIADNGNPDGPSVGEDVTFTTHPSQPLTNEDFPHPPGNDRAYEQVSIPESGGNPANFAFGFSADGDHAIYGVAGGTPISDSGTLASILAADRVETAPHTGGWRSRLLVPLSLYEQPDWLFVPSADFSRFLGYNWVAIDIPSARDPLNLWRIAPGGPYELLSGPTASRTSLFFESSADLSRVVRVVKDSLDPAHPVDASQFHLYDVSVPGDPKLLSLLPDGSVPDCGVPAYPSNTSTSPTPTDLAKHDSDQRGWVSADGSLVFFPSDGNDSCPSDPGSNAQLYVRDIAAAQSTLISGPPLAGPACPAAFIRSVPGAAFFWTKSNLDSADRVPSSCDGTADGDVYRYDIAASSLRCVTCVVPGIYADIDVPLVDVTENALRLIGVSREGSAVYFISPNRLLPGAAKPGIYRVGVSSGELAYVAPAANAIGTLGGITVGDALGTSSAVSADGSVLVFRSDNLGLNPLGDGTDNGASFQYYRYDHTDRSLVCVSCPPDGSAPRAAVLGNVSQSRLTNSQTVNGSVLSADGSVLAFDSPSSLTAADQNTAAAGENPYGGQDVYEWRDGRALLITDGLTNWPSVSPADFSHVEVPDQYGVSSSGRDVFFFAPAQYTPDAPDGYRRLYDARLGGGFEFPPPPPPCPLEVCQGTPQGAPSDPSPSSRSFSGSGNVSEPSPKPRRCPKGKRKVRRGGKVRCVKRHRKPASRRANHDRRAER